MSIFQLQNKKLTVKVNSFGAELCSVVSKETSIEYIWQADTAVWARHAPNLFPIVGKLKDGDFSFEDKSFELPQHGFARDNEFVCVDQQDEYLLFELTATEKTLESFPFHFSLQIGYKLVENKIEVSYSVFNPANEPLYFSIGAHPAFNCPLEKNEKFSDYELLFPGIDELIINVLNDGLITDKTKKIELTNNRLPVSKQLFDNDALVCMNHQIDEVKLVSGKTKHGVSVLSKGWPYYGIWSKKGTDEFVCLEPWYGISDNETASGIFEEKTGIIKLEPEQYFNCSFEILFF
ncbi:MAG: aldose 1-epimerase family protein [Burkholderiales bacterium]|nr:aldose 1-epimerase family protein [Bacteroidia bacterium]